MALDAVYDAAGRSRPTDTDGTVTDETSAIQAVDVTQLRRAILVLE